MTYSISIFFFFCWHKRMCELRIEQLSPPVERGKNGLWALLLFPPSFHGGWLLCSLAPLCGSFPSVQLWAFLLNGVLGSLEHISGQQLRLHLFNIEFCCFTAVSFRAHWERKFFSQHCLCSESMTHAWTFDGNTQFSLWFIMLGLLNAATLQMLLLLQKNDTSLLWLWISCRKWFLYTF